MNLGTISGQVQNSIQQMPANNPEQNQLKETLSKLQQWIEKLPEPTIESQQKANALQQVETIAKSSGESSEKNKGLISNAVNALKVFKSDVSDILEDSKEIIKEVNDIFKELKSLLSF